MHIIVIVLLLFIDIIPTFARIVNIISISLCENIHYLLQGTMGILDEEVSLPEQYNDVPSNENYPGPFNFEVFINPPDNKNWMVSSNLCIYILLFRYFILKDFV